MRQYEDPDPPEFEDRDEPEQEPSRITIHMENPMETYAQKIAWVLIFNVVGLLLAAGVVSYAYNPIGEAFDLVSITYQQVLGILVILRVAGLTARL